MDYLKDIIQDNVSITPFLPMSHTTGWSNFRSIITANKLAPNSKFLKEDVSYFFYGLPYYQVHLGTTDSGTTGMLFNRPVGMLFKESLLNKSIRYFPFDTGAFNRNLFKEHFPKEAELKHFEIPYSNNLHPSKYINLMFGSNKEYMFGRPLCQDPKNISTAEDTLIDFFNSKDIKDFDERCHSIELHLKEEISFSEYIELLILPNRIYHMFEYTFNHKLDGIDKVFYEDSYRYDPKMDSTKILVKAKEYINEKLKLN